MCVALVVVLLGEYVQAGDQESGERLGGHAGIKVEKSVSRGELLPTRREILLRNCVFMKKGANSIIREFLRGCGWRKIFLITL